MEENQRFLDIHLFRHHVPLPVSITILFCLVAVIVSAFFYVRYDADVRYIVVPSIPERSEEFTFGSFPALANAEYFKTVRQTFIDSKSDFLEADLSVMKLSFYESGVKASEYPIITKGREGSWWETPAGIYKIESKNEKSFSSIGKVYMPWSMQFQGNFFIHGWPYYPGGKAVSSAYSGGCIRLETASAEEVFHKVKNGVPVLVYEKDFDRDTFHYSLKHGEISAKSYLAADLKNNFVFIEKDKALKLPIASVTKLMTALISTEYINLDNKIAIKPEMMVKTSKARFKVGDQFSAFQLLYPLLLESSNEAAEAMAGFLGKFRFIRVMNEKAKALGMAQSAFTDTSGSDSGNVSSTEDLFLLSKYLYNNRSFILRMTTGKLGDNAYGPPEFKDLKNFNLVDDPAKFLGGKVGMTTDAGQTMLAVFELELGGLVRPVAVVVLGSKDNIGDVKNILDFIRIHYGNN